MASIEAERQWISERSAEAVSRRARVAEADQMQREEALNIPCEYCGHRRRDHDGFLLCWTPGGCTDARCRIPPGMGFA